MRDLDSLEQRLSRRRLLLVVAMLGGLIGGGMMNAGMPYWLHVLVACTAFGIYPVLSIGAILDLPPSTRALHASLAWVPLLNTLPMADLLYRMPRFVRALRLAEAEHGSYPLEARPEAKPGSAAAKLRQDVDKALPYVRVDEVTETDGELLSYDPEAGGASRENKGMPVLRSAGGQFGLSYGVEDGPNLRFFTLGELRKAGVSHRELHEIALRNLAALVKAPEPGFTLTPLRHAMMLVLGGKCEASLLLLDSLWEGPLKRFAPHGVVAAVPSSNCCIFSDAASAEGIRELQTIIEQTQLNEGDVLSEKLYSRAGRSWREYKPVRAGAAAAMVAGAQGGVEERPQQPKQPSPPSLEAQSRVARAVPYVKHFGWTDRNDGEVVGVRALQSESAMQRRQQPVLRATGQQFGVFYAVDEGSSHSFLSTGEMEDAGYTVEQLHAAAMRNLADRVKEKSSGLSIKALGSALMLELGNRWEPGLMLLDALWEGPLKKFTPNGVIAAVPRRDVCLFCDANSSDGLRELRRQIANAVAAKDPPLLSDRLFARREGRWVAI